MNIFQTFRRFIARYREKSRSVIPLVFIIGSELAILNPFHYVLFSVITFLLMVVLFGLLVDKSFKAWPLFITPFFLFTGSLSFLVLLKVTIVSHIVLGIGTLFLFLYQVHVYNLLYEKEKYQRFSLINLSAYINIYSLFLFASALFGMQLFMNIPIWVSALIIFIATFLLTKHHLWVLRIPKRKGVLYSTMMGLLALELYWAISFFSVHFLVNGVLLTIMYYLASIIMRETLDDGKKISEFTKHIVFAICSIILLLLTAQWF